MTDTVPVTSLQAALANESDAVRKSAAHVIEHGDRDGFHKSAPSRREIALTLFQKVEPLHGHCNSRAEEDRVEVIEQVLGWVMGWGDLDLPEERDDDDRD